MSTTPQTIIDNSIARKKDPDETQWTDAVLLVYLNDALDYLRQLLIENRSRLAVDTSTITTTSGTDLYGFSSYTMTDLVAMFEGVNSEQTGVYCGNAFLSPVDEGEKVEYIGNVRDSSTPTMFYLTDTSIGFLPPVGGTFSIITYFYAKTSDLALDGVMPYNDLFNRALSKFMTSMALIEAGYIAADFTGIYNELERSAMAIVRKRTPTKMKIKYRRR